MTLIEASITNGVRPTVMLIGANSSKPWNRWDRLVAEAYEMYKSERCTQCGLPRWICHNESNEVQFHVDEDQCFAIVAKDRVEGRDKDKTTPPGTVLRPRPYLVDGKELITLRDQYYVDAAKRNAELEALPVS